jgi:hypothetical protein
MHLRYVSLFRSRLRCLRKTFHIFSQYLPGRYSFDLVRACDFRAFKNVALLVAGYKPGEHNNHSNSLVGWLLGERGVYSALGGFRDECFVEQIKDSLLTNYPRKLNVA